jgi:hypothetical protein
MKPVNYVEAEKIARREAEKIARMIAEYEAQLT